MKARYKAAPDFRGYLASVEENRDLWHAIDRRAEVDPAMIERVRALDGRFHLLALSEDWCGDAVNILPVVAALVEAAPNLELRILERDRNPDLMDAHLTGGVSRSIPVVVIYDEEFDEVAWWGPRPTELQEWVVEEGLGMPSDERYREARRFYARDGGRAVVRELLELLEAAPVGC